MKIEYHIITHPKRLELANKIKEQLPKTLTTLYVDSDSNGVLWNHTQALKPRKQNTTHIVIIEDDAILIKDFIKEIKQTITAYPDDLVSGYLGTSYPLQHVKKVKELIAKTKTDYIELPELIHGVCYIIPTQKAEYIHDKINATTNWKITASDFLIGKTYYTRYAKPIKYLYPSIVDHLDETPIVLHNDRLNRTKPRKAIKLKGATNNG